MTLIFPSEIVFPFFGHLNCSGRHGGISEWLEDGVTGILVKSANESELAVAIQKLLQDPKSAMCFGRNGRQKAKSFFCHGRAYRAFNGNF